MKEHSELKLEAFLVSGEFNDIFFFCTKEGLLVCGVGNGTQGLVHARRSVYH